MHASTRRGACAAKPRRPCWSAQARCALRRERRPRLSRTYVSAGRNGTLSMLNGHERVHGDARRDVACRARRPPLPQLCGLWPGRLERDSVEPRPALELAHVRDNACAMSCAWGRSDVMLARCAAHGGVSELGALGRLGRDAVVVNWIDSACFAHWSCLCARCLSDRTCDDCKHWPCSCVCTTQ
jgi:hypothetical protein